MIKQIKMKVTQNPKEMKSPQKPQNPQVVQSVEIEKRG